MTTYYGITEEYTGKRLVGFRPYVRKDGRLVWEGDLYRSDRQALEAAAKALDVVERWDELDTYARTHVTQELGWVRL